MKKKLLIFVFLSSIIFSQVDSLVSVHANETDDKIADQDSRISEIASQQRDAQAQVDQIQSQVSALRVKQETLQAENIKLTTESGKLSEEIGELSANIVSRNKSLANQARSAQTNGPAINYINVIVSSGSLMEAISRVAAMSEIVSANNKMLEQQKKDKELITEKQEANQEAINTVIENQKQLADDAQTLSTKKAELEVAQLDLAVKKATEEDAKALLIEKKAEAERVAVERAAAEAAYKEAQTVQIQTAVASANTSFSEQIQAINNGSSTTYAATSYVPSATSAMGISRGTANSYPIGQCTWGVKTLAPWAGNYWGNGGDWAINAAAAGFRIGYAPKVGAIACWSGGGYGHVAVVTAVQSETSVQVSEANYGGNPAIGNYRGWFNPNETGQGPVSYIYPN